MSSILPITWNDKKNSPLLADFIAKHGAEYCMTAEEINQLRDAVNEMGEIQKTTFLGVAEPTDVPTGTGRGYWEIITPGTYTNFGGLVLAVDERGLIARDEAGTFMLSKAAFSFENYLKVGNKNDSLIIESLSGDVKYFPDNLPLGDFSSEVISFNDYYYSDDAMKVGAYEQNFKIVIFSQKKGSAKIALLQSGTKYIDGDVLLEKGWNYFSYYEVFGAYENTVETYLGVMQKEIGCLKYFVVTSGLGGLQYNSSTFALQDSGVKMKLGLIKKYESEKEDWYYNKNNPIFEAKQLNGSGLTYSYVINQASIDTINRLESISFYCGNPGGVYIDFVQFSNNIDYNDTSNATYLVTNYVSGKKGWNNISVDELDIPFFDGIAYVGVRSSNGVLGFSRNGEFKDRCFEINGGDNSVILTDIKFSYFIKTKRFIIQNEMVNRGFLKLPKGQIDITETVTLQGGLVVQGQGKSKTKCVNKITTANSVVFIVGEGGELKDLTVEGKISGLTKNSNYFNTISEVSNETGIYDDIGILVNGFDSLVSNVNIFNCGYVGVRLYQTTASRTKHYNLNSVQCRNNFIGFDFLPTAEYSTLFGLSASDNIIGIRQVCGNLFFSSCSFNDNRIGLYMYKGGNDAHGSFAACLFNHNVNWSMVLNEISHGQTFVGCHVFDGDIYLLNSIGFNFNGGTIDANILVQGGKKQLVHGTSFQNAYWNRLGGIGNNYNGITSNLVMKNNFFMFEDGENDTIINN